MPGTGRGTHRGVRDGSVDPRGGPGRFVRPVGEDRDGSGDLRGCLERVGVFRHGSGNPPRGPGRGWGPAGRPGTGRGSLGVVWDGPGDPRGVTGNVGGPSG